MEYLVALMMSVLAFVLTYNRFYGRAVAQTKAEKLVEGAYAVQQVLVTADPKSPAYKLAAAGINTTNVPLTWALIQWGGAVAAVVVMAGFGFPPLVIAGAALLGFVAPRSWLDGRIKDRGRRIDADLPQVYVELLALLRANPDVASALIEVSDGLEQEKGPGPLSTELRLTASEAMSANVGREGAMRNLQERSPSISLSNLGLLLERFTQTGAGQGGAFFEAFMAGATNVQGILESRQKAQSKAAEQMQSARIIPVMLAGSLMFFMNDPAFRNSFQTTIVQAVLAGAVVVMYVGYSVMSDIAKEAV